MQPTIYTCDRCHGQVRPGESSCPHCWLKFKARVPPSLANPQPTKPNKIDQAIKKMLPFVPFLLLFDLLCFNTSRLIYNSEHIGQADHNMSVIGAASLAYEADHGNAFPPTDTVPHYKAALAPYITQRISPQQNIDQCFEERYAGPYILNRSLCNKPVSSVYDPGTVFLARAPEAQDGDDVFVAFADGRAATTPLKSFQ